VGRNDLGRQRQNVLVSISHWSRALSKNEALTLFSRCISIWVNVNVIRRKVLRGRPKRAERCMSDRIFQDAYARVRGRHSDQAWFALSPREIADSIYREIRIIDSERLTRAESDFAPVAVAAE
jgi:hypothetical protein